MLPAYAGMILDCYLSGLTEYSAPRIRGDDPDNDLTSYHDFWCSPHTRG